MSESYYRSEHPAVAEWWEQVAQAKAALRAETDAFLAEYPGFTVVFGRYNIASGLRGPTRPAKGWVNRYEPDLWVPNYDSQVGKQISRKLNEIRLRHPTLPGMPPEVFIDTVARLYSPVVVALAGATWAAWRLAEEIAEGNPAFDPTIWQRAKASDYHLAREAQERSET